jgi:glycosyltransferase involved in cell wall biosynthesis
MVVRLVPTPGYRRNVGFGRLFRDAVFGFRAYREALQQPSPDVIITSEPATMGGYAGGKLASRTGAILIYDQMDLWPELIVHTLPPALQFIGHALFWPVYRCRRRLFRKLDGVMALSKPYLSSVLKELPPQRSIPELLVYNGIDVPAFRAAMRQPVPDAIRPHFERPGLKAIFAGSLGPSYDIDGMLGAAELLANRSSDTTIFVAGDGPERVRIEAAASRCQNLVFLGKLTPDILPSVYARCDVGLACYSSRSNVEMCDKFYDYTAAGLVILNSLKGEVRDWVLGERLGLQYEAGSPFALADALRLVELSDTDAQRWKHASFQIGMKFDRTIQHARIADWLSVVIQSASTSVR